MCFGRLASCWLVIIGLLLALVGSAAEASTHYAIITNLANAPKSAVSIDVASTEVRSAALSLTFFPNGVETPVFIPDLVGGFSTASFNVTGNDDMLVRVQERFPDSFSMVVTLRQREGGHNTVLTVPPITQVQGLALVAAVPSSGQAYLLVGAPSGNTAFNWSFTPPTGAQTIASVSLAAARVQRIALPSGTGGLVTVVVTAGAQLIAQLVVDDGKADYTLLLPECLPGITVLSTLFGHPIGSGLQAGSTIRLGVSNHGGATVTIASGNPSLALVSPNEKTAGTAFIKVTVPDGLSDASFVIQGVEGATGTVTVTASSFGFSNGTGTFNIVQPALQIIGLPTSTPSSGLNTAFQVQTGITLDDPSPFSFFEQSVRAGGSAVTATISNSNPAVAQLVTAAATGQSATVQIAAGQSVSPSKVFPGWVEFDPLASGTTTVSATIPGFITTTKGSVLVTVTP